MEDQSKNETKKIRTISKTVLVFSLIFVTVLQIASLLLTQALIGFNALGGSSQPNIITAFVPAIFLFAILIPAPFLWYGERMKFILNFILSLIGIVLFVAYLRM